MTDRIQRLHVVLDKEYREDDVEAIVNALRMVKGVASVDLGEPVDPSDYIARVIVFHEFSGVLINLLQEARDGSDTFKEIRDLLNRKSRR